MRSKQAEKPERIMNREAFVGYDDQGKRKALFVYRCADCGRERLQPDMGPYGPTCYHAAEESD